MQPVLQPDGKILWRGTTRELDIGRLVMICRSTCYANFAYGVHKTFMHPKFQRSASLVSRDPTTEVNLSTKGTRVEGRRYLDKNRVRICSN